MDIEELRTFVEVAGTQEDSRRLAARLGIAKSIVSRRLINLEAELGVQLLTRELREAHRSRRPVAVSRLRSLGVVRKSKMAQETILLAGELRGRLRRRRRRSLSVQPTSRMRWPRWRPVIPSFQIQTCYSD